MNILIIGGAGYIGSQTVWALQDAAKAYNVSVLDNLSTGSIDSIPKDINFFEVDMNDTESLENVFMNNKFDVVMHFAAMIQVSESVSNPSKYYANNFCATKNLLDVMIKHDVKNFIFSSTAAIFGEPQYLPVDEEHPKNPINPYGMSKLFVENILDDYDSAYGLKSVCLRYFNAAGADPGLRTGSYNKNPSHLIPIVVETALGKREKVQIYGNDYNTDDGTAIRDYIHVYDLATAHILALELMISKGESAKYNLGNGKGISVKQIIASVTKSSSKEVNFEKVFRRAGDPAKLIADSTKAETLLQWKQKYANVDDIVKDTLNWYKKCANGL